MVTGKRKRYTKGSKAIFPLVADEKLLVLHRARAVTVLVVGLVEKAVGIDPRAEAHG